MNPRSSEISIRASLPIDVALVISSGQEYSPTFNQLGDDWGLPIMSMVMYYLLRTIVQSFSEDDDLVQGSRFWGV